MPTQRRGSDPEDLPNPPDHPEPRLSADQPLPSSEPRPSPSQDEDINVGDMNAALRHLADLHSLLDLWNAFKDGVLLMSASYPNNTFIVSVIAFLTVSILGLGTRIHSYLVGYAYPVYASVRAIEGGTHDDVTQWLTYWVVFSTFTLAEYGLDYLLYWLPMYWICKTFFLFWCMAPVTCNGSVILYHYFIRPLTLGLERLVLDIFVDDPLASNPPSRRSSPTRPASRD